MNMKFSNLLTFLFVFTTVFIFAQDDAETNSLSDNEEAAALAKASQNPLAAMYSFPIQNNTTFNGTLGTTNVLNIQPVIPIALSEKVNLINRIVIPVLTVPTSPNDKSTGMGNTTYTAWFSPAKESKILWGVGPAFQIPTSSGAEFGNSAWGVGPSVVALKMIDKWVVGLVLNNVWTFSDNSSNNFFFQYFVNYNLPKAWYLTSAPIITANWDAVNSDDIWVVPFGGGFGKVFKIGEQPINFNCGVYYNAQRPNGYGDITTRFQLQLMFPKKKK